MLTKLKISIFYLGKKKGKLNIIVKEYVLGCVKSMANRSREMILLLCFVAVGSHLECCIQLQDPQHRKDIDLRATKLFRGMEHLSSEERLRELGLFSLEKEVLG